MHDRRSMEKNGLENRSREQKIGLWVGGICSFFVISFFLVPFYLPAETVPELSGRANAMDYYSEDSWGNLQVDNEGKLGHNQSEYGIFAWSELDFYAAFIYGFGDFNCHNKAERSWKINDNQMPVCVRDVGIFAGLAIGGLLFSRRGYNRWTIRDTFFSIIPDNKIEFVYKNDYRMKLMLLIAFLSIAPMGFDGFTQLLTSYESNAVMRLVTGLPFGIFVGLFLSSSFAARPAYFDFKPEQVELPLNTKFRLPDTESE